MGIFLFKKMQKKILLFKKFFVIKSNWVSWRSSTRNLHLDFLPTVLYSFRNDIDSTKKYCLFAKRVITKTSYYRQVSLSNHMSRFLFFLVSTCAFSKIINAFRLIKSIQFFYWRPFWQNLGIFFQFYHQFRRRTSIAWYMANKS